MSIWDLNGQEGNSFTMIETMTRVDPSLKFEDLLALGGYHSILRKFEQVCGQKYHIINFPAGYKRFT